MNIASLLSSGHILGIEHQLRYQRGKAKVHGQNRRKPAMVEKKEKGRGKVGQNGMQACCIN